MVLRQVAPVLLVGALVAATPGVSAGQTVIGTPAHDTAKGAALLADAKKALGGEDKIAAVKRLQVKGTVQRVQGNQTLDGDIDLQIEVPDKFRMDEEISLPGGAITITRTQALNGAEVWDVTEGGNLPGGFGRGGRGGRFGGAIAGALGNEQGTQPAQADPARAAALREQQRRTRQTELTRYLLAFLATTSEPVAWLGTARTPKEETADVLEVTTADGNATRLFLDTTTHLPLMMTFAGPGRPQAGGGGRGRRGEGGGNPGGPAAAPEGAAPGGRGNFGGRPGGDAGAAAAPQGPEAGQGRRGGVQAQATTVEMYLSNYKAENGLMMPHVITREINGEIQEELVLKNFKLNPNFKSNTFTQPKQ